MKYSMVILSFLACLSSAWAEPLMLVTDEEVARDAAAPIRESLRKRAIVSANAPKIQVLSPDPSKDKVSTPLPVDIKFSSASDAEIDPASFRAYYGMLHLDITDRILQKVTITKNGLAVSEAAIPRGNHRLLLQVKDTQGRKGEDEIRFSVEAVAKPAIYG
jgi:hypothetical protein